ncbi:MAG: hypothetical protein MAG431_00875 [Chloroflexi bacterium]|nr:hypothetical protein [Chloroflexota bacterium]
MTVFQNQLWGYELTYPGDWIHKTDQEREVFAAVPEAFRADYRGPQAAQLLVRGEWNGQNKPIESLWGQHVGKLAVMVGAKNTGSASWQMGGASGFEVEIVLPKRDEKRLWVGVLSRGLILLHFTVVHHKEERDRLDPLFTQIISSLAFIERANEIKTNSGGFPLPPGYIPVPPDDVIDDIANIKNWKAYKGGNSMGALQAFYFRELPNYGWEMDEFLPFPSEHTGINFARIKIHQRKKHLTLGILPFGEEPAKLVIQKTG